MLHFKRTIEIDAPVEIVWQFHERPDILELLTPPWQPVTVVRREGGLGVGAMTEFLIQLGPIPVKWVACHTECEPNRLFVDEQIDGPMESWVHRHQFVAKQGKTYLTDAIAFEMPGAGLSEMAIGWWVRDRLNDMFAYRHRTTKEECEKQAQKIK